MTAGDDSTLTEFRASIPPSSDRAAQADRLDQK